MGEESATFGSAEGSFAVNLRSDMNRTPLPSDDSWESDAVWKLLDQAQPLTPSARFVDDTVRAAKLCQPEKSWWSKLFAPMPLAALAGATAAVAFGLISIPGPHSSGTSQGDVAVIDSQHAVDIQEIAETETLIAATDRLDDFSDTELVSLIGF